MERGISKVKVVRYSVTVGPETEKERQPTDSFTDGTVSL